MGPSWFGLLMLLALAWAVPLYSDFIARDPTDFDTLPRLGKLCSGLLLIAPFFFVAFGLHISSPGIYSALLSIAVSTLVVPAIASNMTGPGLTSLTNVAVKAGVSAIFAVLIIVLTAMWPSISWYAVLVFIGAFSMWSRKGYLLVAVQDETKSSEWNDGRVRAMSTFIRKSSLAYLLIAFVLGGLVDHSIRGAETWNKGWSELVAELVAKATNRAKSP